MDGLVALLLLCGYIMLAAYIVRRRSHSVITLLNSPRTIAARRHVGILPRQARNWKE